MNGEDYEKRVVVFARSLKWYVKAQFNTNDDYFATLLVEYFAPGPEFSPKLKAVYCSLIAEINNCNQLNRLMSTLCNFEIDKEDFTDLIISIRKRSQPITLLHGDNYDDLKNKSCVELTGFKVMIDNGGRPLLCDQISKAIETMFGDHETRKCLLAITKSFEDPGSIQT